MFPGVAHSILIHRVMMALQPTGQQDLCFPMDSDMSSDFKLDLVEKLFAIDTQSRTPVTTQQWEAWTWTCWLPTSPWTMTSSCAA
ncbi:hypoxia-inducible factor 1-alpha-like [Genypterus blacodes]|uniref:hypoxia-inducible factor 1-alpha-like n=1 Tax=Genypterus blacodes TaxID=154954 RepID=UPI003F76FEF0